MFSSQGSTTMLHNSTWNGDEGMVTSLPVDSSVSQMLDSQAFLYTNTDTMNAPYVENSLPIEKTENVNCAGPSSNSSLNSTLRSSLVPIQPSISSSQRVVTEIRIRPQATGELSNISHDKVLTIEELRSIENRHSVNITDDTTLNASNESIRPSLNTALRPAVIPIQPATTPSSGRPRCGRKRKAESIEEKEARTKERILRNRQAAQTSRNKKRQQLADLEGENATLKEESNALRESHIAELAAHREENERLAKRVRTLETKLEDMAAEFERFRSQQLQSQNVLPSPEMIIHSPLDGVRGSAADRQVEEPLQDVFANSFQADMETNSDDLLTYLDLDFWANELSSMLG